jgi:hypothetical protein
MLDQRSWKLGRIRNVRPCGASREVVNDSARAERGRPVRSIVMSDFAETHTMTGPSSTCQGAFASRWVSRGINMNDDELRAEIERRKKHAEDLKIKETLWSLREYFRFHDKWERDDPEFAYPWLSDQCHLSENTARFSIGQNNFTLSYRKDREASEDSPGRWEWAVQIVHGAVTLKVDDEAVFEFSVTETTTYTRDCPLFDKTLGEVTRFIEGPWVSEVADLEKAIAAHRQSVLAKRRAAYEARKLAEEKKRFGLSSNTPGCFVEGRDATQSNWSQLRQDRSTPGLSAYQTSGIGDRPSPVSALIVQVEGGAAQISHNPVSGP